MRFLIITICSLIVGFPLQAQKKLQEGQFFYNCYKVDNGKEIEEGKAVVLRRGEFTRFDYLTPATNGRKDVYIRMLINDRTDSLEMKMTFGEKVLFDEKIKFSNIQDVLRTRVFGNYTATKDNKSKNTFGGYKGTKYICETTEEEGAPSVIAYLSAKITIKKHPFFVVLAPEVPLKGFPLEFSFAKKGKKHETFRIESIVGETPDAIWFDLEKTPIYPLYPRKAGEKDTDKKDALTPFLVKQYDLNGELVKDYEAVLRSSLEAEFSSSSMELLEKDVSNARQIEETYNRWIESLGQAKGIDDNTGVKTFFIERRLNEMNTLWENRVDVLVAINEQLISDEQLSTQAIDKSELLAYSPFRAFGREKERYQSLTILQATTVLQHLQNNNRMLSAIFMNKLLQGKNSADLVYDKFEIFQTSPKDFIRLGEQYEAEIMLGARSSQARFRVSVNGQSLKVKDGIATYKTVPSSIGEHKYTAQITIRNPLTGMTEVLSREFNYEVGVPSAIISPDKMNVFYMGVNNPITVMAAGVASSNLVVKLSNPDFGELVKAEGGKYNFIPKRLGRVEIVMRNKKIGKTLARFTFRIKRIPDPRVQLGMRENKGGMQAAKLNKMRGLMTVLDNFDFDAKCLVKSFTFNYSSKEGKNIQLQQDGLLFTGKVLELIQQAKAGDFIIFSNIKVRCKGDKAERSVNNLGIPVN